MNATMSKPVGFADRDRALHRLSEHERDYSWGSEILRVRTALTARAATASDREIETLRLADRSWLRRHALDLCGWTVAGLMAVLCVSVVGLILSALIGLVIDHTAAQLVGYPAALASAGTWVIWAARKDKRDAARPFVIREPELTAGRVSYAVELDERTEGTCAHVTVTLPGDSQLHEWVILGSPDDASELISERFHVVLAAVEGLRAEADAARTRKLAAVGLDDDSVEATLERMIGERVAAAQRKQLTAEAAKSLNAYATERLSD